MFRCPYCGEKSQASNCKQEKNLTFEDFCKLVNDVAALFHDHGASLAARDPLHAIVQDMLATDILPFSGYGVDLMNPTIPQVPNIIMTADQLDDMAVKVAALLSQAGVDIEYREEVRNIRGVIVKALEHMQVKNIPEQRKTDFNKPSVVFGKQTPSWYK
jgi:hypothetical protein